jgi:hypothetical protein
LPRYHLRRQLAVAQPQPLEVGHGVDLAPEPAAALGALDAAGDADHAQLVVGIPVDAGTVSLKHPRRHIFGAETERHGGKDVEDRRLAGGIARPCEGGLEVARDDGVQHLGGRRNPTRFQDLDGDGPGRHVLHGAAEDTDAFPRTRQDGTEGRLHLDDARG